MRFVGRHVTEQRDLLLGGRTCWAKEDRRQPATSRLRGIRIEQRAGSEAIVRGIGGRITHPQDTSTFLYPRNIRPHLALAAAHVTITSPCRPTAGLPSGHPLPARTVKHAFSGQH
jgi:hypothetical protein